MHQIIEHVENISHHPEWSVAHKMDEILALGAQVLRMDMGSIVEVKGEKCRVSRVVAEPQIGIRNGQIFDLWELYTGFVLKAGGLFQVESMKESPYWTYQCYRNFSFQTFMGINMVVGGEVFGTLEFGGMTPRSHLFSTKDQNVMYLLGATLAEIIERDKQNQQADQTVQVVKRIS